MVPAEVMMPKVVLLRAELGALRLTKLNTLVASPQNWNFTRPWIPKSRKMEASTFLVPGAGR